MLKEFERIKSGRSCGLDKEEVSLSRAIDEIVNCELSWGAKVTIEADVVYFETKVFGDIDKTKFTGDVKDMELVKSICNVWPTGKRNAVNNILLNHMGVEHNDNKFKLEDVLICLDLFLAGSKPDELSGLLSPVEAKVVARKPSHVSTELVKMAKSLDSDDAVKHIVNMGILANIVDEAHQPNSKVFII